MSKGFIIRTKFPPPHPKHENEIRARQVRRKKIPALHFLVLGLVLAQGTPEGEEKEKKRISRRRRRAPGTPRRSLASQDSAP